MWSRISYFLLLLFALMGCADGVLGPGSPTGTEERYPIYDDEMNELGEFVVQELSNNSFEVTVDLTTLFTNSVSIELYDDNAVDVGSKITEIGILDANTSGVFYERPEGFTLSYRQMTQLDGSVGFFEGTTRVAYADIGGNGLTGEFEEYPLSEIDFPGISGEARFYQRQNQETLVVVELEGTQAGGDHPAHVHNNSQIIGGNIAINLTNVDGATGLSFTNVVRTNNGRTRTYEEMTLYNGYIAVHNSQADFNSFIVQGDIGGNKFTGREISYPAKATSPDNVSGTVTFKERSGGSTLVIVELPNDVPNVIHPVHIHRNTAVEGGSIIIDLTSFNTISYTDVSRDNDDNILTYDDLVEYSGYVNVHFSDANFNTNLAQADIGVNAFTGQSKEYSISEIDGSGLSGSALFEERISGETLVTMNIDGTAGTNRAAHIHQNSAGAGGGIVINLSQVNGDSGISLSNVAQFNSNSPIRPGQSVTFSELMDLDGHIAIHVSPTGGNIIAKGNIGSNAN